MSTLTTTPEATVTATAEAARDRLVALSHQVHGHPELAFAEHRSAAAVSAVLAEAGFAVDQGVAGLDTAFVASYGSGDFVVGICAEYDALPGIGHACGHNVIAASAVGAGLALAEVADEIGLTVKVIGTPAEEHGGGKVLMLEAGVFDDLAVSLMVHPGSVDAHPAVTQSQGVSRHRATFTGKAAHAAAAPHLAVNAADAAVVAQVALGLLRQQLPATAKVAAFVSDGGEATNIVPERSTVELEVREFDLESLTSLRERVLACFEAGALATGCTLEIEETEPSYAPLVQDPRLAEPYAAAIRGRGREVLADTPLAGGSTDMGNVSQHVPSIHPIIAVVGSDNAPHTHAFADDAISAAADDTVVDGAVAMALTVVAVATDPTLRAELAREQQNRAPFTPEETR